MPRLALPMRITALVVATALAVPWGAAAAPAPRHEIARPRLWQQIWIVFADFLDAGCQMDPSGRCIAGSTEIGTTVTPDDGCRMDPDGRCVADR